MDIRAAVIESIDKMIADDLIKPVIEAQIEKVVTSIVKDLLSEYGDFGKVLKEKIKQSLEFPAEGGDLDLPSYNHALVQVIQRCVKHASETSMQREVAGKVAAILNPAPKSIALSTLIDMWRDHLAEQVGCSCDAPHTFHVAVEESEGSLGYRSVSFGPGGDKHHRASFRGHDVRLQCNGAGEVYHAWFSDQDTEKALFAGPMYGFFRAVFQMRVAGTVLEFDCVPSDCDLSYAHAESM